MKKFSEYINESYREVELFTNILDAVKKETNVDASELKEWPSGDTSLDIRFKEKVKKNSNM